MPKYAVKIVPHTRGAQTKGRIERGTDFVFNADDHNHAYTKLQVGFKFDDSRQLMGKSYLGSCVVHPLRVGDRVRLLTPYKIGFNDNGSEKRESRGTIAEVVNDTNGYVSVWLDGYNQPFVDFVATEYYVEKRASLKASKEFARKVETHRQPVPAPV